MGSFRFHSVLLEPSLHTHKYWKLMFVCGCLGSLYNCPYIKKICWLVSRHENISVWISNPYTSISPTFFLKDKDVRSQKGIWTHLCKDVLHTYLDFTRHLILFVNVTKMYLYTYTCFCGEITLLNLMQAIFILCIFNA